MNKKRTVVIVAIAGPTLIVCLVLSALTVHLMRPVYRELRPEEIRRSVRRMTGHELPEEACDLRGILFNRRGRELYVAFETDPNGCSYIVDAFRTQHLEASRGQGLSPEDWWMGCFVRGCVYQRGLGTVVFDPILVNRVGLDAKVTEHACYVRASAESKVRYVVLVFRDRGLVYLFAAG